MSAWEMNPDQDFQLLTQGLLMAQPIKIRINYMIRCTSPWVCWVPWKISIEGELNGHSLPTYTHHHVGSEGWQDDLELTFTGLMPGHGLSGKLIFKILTVHPVQTLCEIPIHVANTSDVPPDGDGPVVCNEGEWYCDGTMKVICEKRGGVCDWYEYPNHSDCKAEPPPNGNGDGNGGEPPNGGNGMDWQAWIEKYKWVIIGASVAVIGLAIFLIRRK